MSEKYSRQIRKEANRLAKKAHQQAHKTLRLGKLWLIWWM